MVKQEFCGCGQEISEHNSTICGSCNSTVCDNCIHPQAEDEDTLCENCVGEM